LHQQIRAEFLLSRAYREGSKVPVLARKAEKYEMASGVQDTLSVLKHKNIHTFLCSTTRNMDSYLIYDFCQGNVDEVSGEYQIISNIFMSLQKKQSSTK